VGLAGHQEDGFDFGPQPAIHQRHLEFVFVVRDGANTSQNDACAALGHIVHEQAAEGSHFDVRKIDGHFPQHFDSFFQTEERPLFIVAEDGDDQAIEQSRPALDQIQVAVGNWIEGAGVDGHNRGGFRSQGGSVSDRRSFLVGKEIFRSRGERPKFSA
jgi:hypothetical protein